MVILSKQEFINMAVRYQDKKKRQRRKTAYDIVSMKKEAVRRENKRKRAG